MLILKENPVGEDVPINTIQNALFAGLVTNGTWTNYESYHRAYKNETDEGIRPEVFTGTENGNEYRDVFSDDDFTVTSFFLVPDNIPVVDDMHTANISIIFQANLDKIYPDATHRFDAEMHNEIENILKNLDGTFSFIDTHTSLDDVYEGLDISKVQFDDMQKFHVVRFEIEANYQQECGVTFASSVITCNIAVSVTTTDETSLGANDGTATANDSGGQGAITYFWTTSDGNIPAGEEIKKTATGLSPGTYSVVVTDDILVSCTASDSGVVGSASVCTVSLVVSVTPETFAGFKDGTADATPSGGQGSLTFAWTGPLGFTSTDQNITDLLAGIYTCIVTDSIEVGCTATDNGTVSNIVTTATNLVLAGDDASTINAGSPIFNDPVEDWLDRSGDNNDANQPTPSAQPLWKTTFLKGDGNDWMSLGTILSKLTVREVFIVYKADSVASNQFVYSDGDPAAASKTRSLSLQLNSGATRHNSFYGDGVDFRITGGDTAINTNLTLYNDNYTSGSGPLVTMQVNGNDQTEVDVAGIATTIAGTAFDLALWRVGEASLQFFTGEIHFMALFTAVLSSGDRTIVTDAFKTKYPALP